MKTTFKLHGFQELGKALQELPKATARNVLKRTALKAMQPLEDRAKALAPKEDGDLADSITTQVVPARRATSSVEVATGPAPQSQLTKSNANWQERGTEKMPANPYMRPAADETSGQVVAGVRDHLKDEVGKASARVARKAARKG